MPAGIEKTRTQKRRSTLLGVRRRINEAAACANRRLNGTTDSGGGRRGITTPALGAPPLLIQEGELGAPSAGVVLNN
jgi:hypothetical protein